MHFKLLSAKWQPFCLGLNVLTSLFFKQLKIFIFVDELNQWHRENWYTALNLNSEWLIMHSQNREWLI